MTYETYFQMILEKGVCIDRSVCVCICAYIDAYVYRHMPYRKQRENEKAKW